MGYIVNTAKCRIPDIDPWNPAIKALTNKIPPIDCKKQRGHWTYVNKRVCTYIIYLELRNYKPNS